MVAGILLAAIAACGDDGQRPEQEFAGAYELSSVDERPLPHVYWCSRMGACLQVNAGRLEVMSRGRVREILTVANAGSTVPLTVDTIISTYRFEGTRLVLTRSRSYGSVYEYADTATVQNDRLSFKPQYIGVNHGGGGTFYYVKQ